MACWKGSTCLPEHGLQVDALWVSYPLEEGHQAVIEKLPIRRVSCKCIAALKNLDKLSVGGDFQWHNDACIKAPLIIAGAKRCTVAWAELITLKQPAVEVDDRRKGKLLADTLIQVHSNLLESVLELRKLHGTAFCCTHVTIEFAVCSVRLCAAVPVDQTRCCTVFRLGLEARPHPAEAHPGDHSLCCDLGRHRQHPLLLQTTWGCHLHRR